MCHDLRNDNSILHLLTTCLGGRRVQRPFYAMRHPWRSKQYIGGWNTEHILYYNGSPLFGFPMAFRFKPNGSHFLGFQWFGFEMVGTIALAIALTNHSKTEPLEIQTSKYSVFQCVRYSNVGHSSPTHCIQQFCCRSQPPLSN